MPGTVLWFCIVIMVCGGAWYAGQVVTRVKDPVRSWSLMGFAFLMLLFWTALIRNPALAVHVIPVSVLARLEGVGAAPIFVFIVSIAWGLSVLPRQRVVLILSMFVCCGYILQGGIWMMKPTPTNAFSERAGTYYIKQTQDYSCVPAATATALRMLGVATDEAEMAELTETRAGSGATLLRAFNGLNQRLAYSGISAELLEPSYDQLMAIQPPILTPLRYDTTRLHMVTLLEVRPDLVVVADPQLGIEFLSRRVFEAYYNNQVIVFIGGQERATMMDVLAQQPHMEVIRNRLASTRPMVLQNSAAEPSP